MARFFFECEDKFVTSQAAYDLVRRTVMDVLVLFNEEEPSRIEDICQKVIRMFDRDSEFAIWLTPVEENNIIAEVMREYDRRSLYGGFGHLWREGILCEGKKG